MRAPLFVVLGLVVGALGTTLFQRSLPPPAGTEAEKIAELERTLERDRLRIAALEATEANAATRREKLAASGRRSIFDDLKAGRPVDLNDMFNASKPFLHEVSPLFERLRRLESKQRIERAVADLTQRYDLTESQQESLKQWLDDQAIKESGKIAEVTGRADSTLMDYAKAHHDFHSMEEVDSFMQQTLQGEALAEYQKERLAERVNRVQYEAERRVEQLDAMVGLDEAQQDQVFALMARGSKDFDPSMQFEGLGNDRAAIPPGQSRDDAILAVLRPEQRTTYEAGRQHARDEATREMAEVGIKLPDDWDLFEW